jgi:methylisocitrate lyase
VSASDMRRKISAAKRAADSLLVCARTDAAATSLDEAVERSNAYVDAGADIVFVEALVDAADIRRMRSEVSAPLLANMTEFGRTPNISAAQWGEFGYDLVIFPVSSLRVAARAMQSLYRDLKQDGEATKHLPSMMTRKELYEVIDYFGYERLDTSIATSSLPDGD